MNFQQLRIVRETLRHNFNLTEVANALFTSQSGVSKHIKDLEDELGVELYVRKGKRLLGLTEPGKELVKIVERMLLDANNIKNLADQYSRQDSGNLTIATTHTQARYALPGVVTAFKQHYPKVHLKLHQGSPAEIAQLLLNGEADIGIATESLSEVAELRSFPYYSWRHDVIVPLDHPLEALDSLGLQAISEHPVITYHEGFTGRARIEKAFSDAGVVPDIVMSALDADVIKSYVELGLGIGIIASMAFDAERDTNLRRLDCSQLFEENLSRIAVRRGHYLRRYAYHFIELCSPLLTEEHVKANISHSEDPSTLLRAAG
ncbi:MAG: CysB family HTH-type transcriptional regulator [Porticoccaceae bacterium]